MKLNRIIVILVLMSAIGAAQNDRDEMDLNSMELTDNWQFREKGAENWMQATVPGCVHIDLFSNKKIGDPFYRTNERDQQWIDKVNWEYRTTFKADPEYLNSKNQRMVFEGLDTYADVFLNGQKIFSADNMFRTWKVDVKNILKENNELNIVFNSPVDTDLPKIDDMGYQLPAINDQSENGGLGDRKISIFARKAPYHYGWDWGPRFVTMGIWRPVRLETWNDARIESVQFRQSDVSKSNAKLLVNIEINAKDHKKADVTIRDKRNNKVMVSKSLDLSDGIKNYKLEFEIKNPELWWCNGLGDPHLYTFSTEVIIGNKVSDQQNTKIGIRSLRVVREKDEHGKSFYVELNGVPVFAKGANYIPNDNFLTRVTPAKYQHIVKSAANANMNMLRVWGGGIYENDIFYDLCDQYGILIWQDFMFACSMYPGDDAFIENVKQEAIDNIKRLRNHPSIALWCGNNEIDTAWSLDVPGGWRWKERFSQEVRDKIWADYEKIFHKLLPDLVKDFDPDRFYWPSSPLADFGVRASYSTTSGDMHYWGVWHGKEPFEQFKKVNARFMSEYGFQSFPEFKTVKTYTISEDWDISSEVMSAHQRSGIGNERIKMYMGWDYHLPKAFVDMLYMSHVLQAEGIKDAIYAHRLDKPYCMGTLYWQINDCWPVASWSSIDYYGRWKALQYFAKKAYTPVVIIPTLDENIVNISVVSDRLNDFIGDLRLEMINFKGEIQLQAEKTVSIPANGNENVFSSEIQKLAKDADLTETVLICSLREKNQIISQDFLYFKPVKELNLPDANVKLAVTESPTGYEITLTSNALAKNVYLTCDAIDGFFTDNYFDLLPGRPVTVTYQISTPRVVKKDLFKVRTVKDTY